MSLMYDLNLLIPFTPSERLQKMINAACSDKKVNIVNNVDKCRDLCGKRVLIAAHVNESGHNMELMKFISELSKKKVVFDNASGGILCTSSSEYFTKSFSRDLIFYFNSMGMNFIGHPLVEATDSLKNFLTWQKVYDMPLMDICLMQCKKLGDRLSNEDFLMAEKPYITVLHSSMRETSNTLTLWGMIKKHLNFDINEINVSNGKIFDCTGCTFKTCIHYSKQESCFYGGPIVKEIYPSIKRSSAIVFISPNYNDAVSANLCAVINRLTALYRKMKFNNKALFAVIVSGNSGSDLVAKQLIGALNINKGFYLPNNFAIMETANDFGAILKVQNIENKAENFARHIIECQT